ncbi:TetR/AcrR family transcriptional regulator [Bosea sp. LjRoot9]|uniref:TetR/AcrR family transcriptional regulator n=1 Tax=Bosea sp. LjRoot9 TaxID=3342341 RepID=UPI003ECD9D3A
MTKIEAGSARGGYHHGDLRQAMITAAEAVLAEKGLAGFTLRECARRAGVSPAAPAHHFGNLTGLLTAIATLGFDGLSDAMEAAAEAASHRANGNRMAAICDAYLATALDKPGRFRVVFGQMGLNWEEPDFKRASGRAFGILVRETRCELGRESGDDLLTRHPPSFAGEPDLAAILFVWSVTHGFTTLLIDGQLDFLAEEGGREVLLGLYSRQLVAILIAALRTLDLPPPEALAKPPGDS